MVLWRAGVCLACLRAEKRVRENGWLQGEGASVQGERIVCWRERECFARLRAEREETNESEWFAAGRKCFGVGRENGLLEGARVGRAPTSGEMINE